MLACRVVARQCCVAVGAQHRGGRREAEKRQWNEEVVVRARGQLSAVRGSSYARGSRSRGRRGRGRRRRTMREWTVDLGGDCGGIGIEECVSVCGGVRVCIFYGLLVGSMVLAGLFSCHPRASAGLAHWPCRAWAVMH